MEVMRNEEPKNNFLKKINLATKKGIVLILMNVLRDLEKILEDCINYMV